ncbi:type I-E CRISPR-associated endoribonuclease Cas2e [uncultured Ruminococcus sp.]|uniref:type I-E CRISPR-associated endoribonuclease Cas2e n=1 Tax=uncultured Ruminococcus sp. TaxID=165186 RepID=UPI0025F622D4|nr:type I-E CRISPR-associated endoribonuclease Cas2e [uncultured Ruminococcus sp.]
MVVLTMTNCPPKLRGDLSKWLLEINTGVYVGNVNARVRELIWKRVCENIKDGQATMVFPANNEQHMDFYVHNTSWQPVDLDGIKLMKHPRTSYDQNEPLKSGFSNAAKRQMGLRKSRQKAANRDNSFVIIDIETTGLSAETDEIIEIGAIRVVNGKKAEEYEQLICVDKKIPQNISALTGITQEQINENGKPIQEVLPSLIDFINDSEVVGYNVDFDREFLLAQCDKLGMDITKVKFTDVMVTIKNKLKGMRSYKLESVAKRLGIKTKQQHRALEDCHLLYQVYCKLNENG